MQNIFSSFKKNKIKINLNVITKDCEGQRQRKHNSISGEVFCKAVIADEFVRCDLNGNVRFLEKEKHIGMKLYHFLGRF